MVDHKSQVWISKSIHKRISSSAVSATNAFTIWVPWFWLWCSTKSLSGCTRESNSLHKVV
jgi:hypothetical protein